MCLKRLLELSPCNAAALAEVSKLKRAKKDYALRSKEIQRNMAKRLFNGKDSSDTATAATASVDSPLPPKVEPAGQIGSSSGSVHSSDGDSTPSSSSNSSSSSDARTQKSGSNSSDTRMKAPGAVEATPPSSVEVSTAAANAAGSEKSGGEKTGAAAVAAAAAYSGLDTGNVVVLLVTSLIVLAISVYIAVFATSAST